MRRLVGAPPQTPLRRKNKEVVAVPSDRTTRLYIRVTPEEKDKILSLAQQAGLASASEYVRRMAIDGQIVKREYVGLREMASQIGKIGSNVNQIAKRANERRYVPQEDIDEVMLCLRQILRLLDKLVKNIMKG